MVSGAREEFAGTARFAIRRRLGAGGMGVVYHAYDRKLGVEVALKTLKNIDAAALYHFKREFRALVDVSHPNLVSLHELVSEGDQWFFTMELVHGTNFFEYVCTPDEGLKKGLSTIEFRDSASMAEVFASDPGGISLESVLDADTEILTTLGRDHDTAEITHSTMITETQRRALGGPTELTNYKRLRDALQQLAQGLNALHATGKLHRDMKPSNVLVSRAGRLVILDFGLVADIDGESSQFLTSTQKGIAGTFAYMAPEQALSEPLTPAADWYAVGVMLYEALTGRLPFPETGLDVLMRKQREMPKPPAALIGGIPPEFNQLCIDLLRIEPEARPSGKEVWERLASATSSTSTGIRVPRAALLDESPFIGRGKHLSALETGFSVAREHSVALLVRGSSGMGKTVLVRRFLEAIREREDAIILSGRCYEREYVPYKAVDSLIDSLSRYLSKLPKLEVAALLPRGVSALARVFPVLNRVPAIAAAHRLPALTPDKQELRRRAFSALKELLARIADNAPVVMFIDDLQWGDVDSAQLLTDLLKPPDAPCVLLIGCYRTEDELESSMLQELLRLRTGMSNFRTLTIGSLSTDEATDLAITLLGDGEDASWKIARRIASEAAGNPFFVDALARSVRDQRARGAKPTIRLKDVLVHELNRLPEGAQQLLEVIAVAGRPVNREVLLTAAGQGARIDSAVLDKLRSVRFVRTTSADGDAHIECYHDKIREAALSQLSPERTKRHHASLVSALSEKRPEDIDALFHHSLEAGNRDVAGQYAVEAADQAQSSLAFGRASALYQVALDLEAPNQSKSQLVEKLAGALASSGRGKDAAEAYLRAAEEAAGLHNIELRRKAGLQLLIGGYFDEGLGVLSEVLDKLGLKMPKTSAGAYASLAMANAQLWKRGLSFEAQPRSEIDDEDLVRIDALYAIASGVGLVDPVMGAEVQARHLLLALKVGEPLRAARALALSASYAGGAGGKGEAKAEMLRSEANRLARRVEDPRIRAMATMANGIIDNLRGDWAKSKKALLEAEQAFQDTCEGATWELAATRTMLGSCLWYNGDYKALGHRFMTLLDDADQRGALFEATSLRLGFSNSLFLARDNPERSLRVLQEGIARWSQSGFHIQHYLSRTSLGQTYIYMGKGTKAVAVLDETWPALRDSKLMQSQYLRVDAGFIRARALIAAALQTKKHRSGLLAEALRFTVKIESEEMSYIKPLGSIVRAGVATFDDPKASAAHLEHAIAGCEAHSMRGFAEAARFRLGTLIGGHTGERMRQVAGNFFIDQGIRNIERFVDVLAPGRY